MGSHQINRALKDNYLYHGRVSDPGDAGAITVPDTVMEANCDMVTAGSETRTVSVPTVAGQQLHLVLQTDGGNSAVTFPAAVSGANTIITFGDDGDYADFTAIDVAGTLTWKINAAPADTGVSAS